MEFDALHGLVERGTPGIHSGAVVEDIAHEVAILEGFAAMARVSEIHDALLPSCEERRAHHVWRAHTALLRGDKEFHAYHTMHLKLAMLTPYVTTMRAREAHIERQRQRPPDPRRAMLTTPRRALH